MYTYSFVMQKISIDRERSHMNFPKGGAHEETQHPWEVLETVSRELGD